ncbi:replication Fork Protection Component Swi3 [Trichinella nativa]|uniref:TIMELESS-interacting protein n=1 Tax=Trichinella nativa TaxID=6335 RepID=A0A1Y3EPI0_9BILA|nr:replication Fork Protection Component Swi3 [Trichinella nativa]
MEDNNSDLLPYEYEELDNNSDEEDIGKIKRNILSKKGDKGEKSDDANESKISKLFDESHALATRRRTTVPHVKLNEARFVSHRSSSSIVFSNLNAVMHKMELWAHQLYPSLRFDDVLERLEKLGHKNTVQTFLAKCREDAFRRDSDSSEGEAENAELSLKDLFFMDANKSNNYNDLSNAKNEVEKTEQTQLTEEQLARIEANRLRAKQLREQKQVKFVKSVDFVDKKVMSEEKTNSDKCEIAHDAAGNSDHNVQPVNISGGKMLTEAEIMAELASD